MKKVVISAVVIGSLLGGMLSAQADDVLRVGVLDVRKVVLESKPGQKNRAELEAMVKQEREKITKEENSVKALQDKFEKDKLTLTDAQKQQRQKEFETKVAALQKMSKEAQERVQKRDNEMSAKANEAMRDIVSQIATEEKVAMVIDKAHAGVLWIQQPVDITEKVVKAYEAKVK